MALECPIDCWDECKVRSRSLSAHGGSLYFTLDKPPPRASQSLHAGNAFAHRTEAKSSMLETLGDDVMNSIVACISSPTVDFGTLVALLSVCKAITPYAHAALASTSAEERVQALTCGQIPASALASVERQAAVAAERGELTASNAASLFWYANLFVDDKMGPAQQWLLSFRADGPDVGVEKAFPLIGFDNLPLAGATHLVLEGGPHSGVGLVTDWYAAHKPEQPLTNLHLPCVLAGPPMRAARGGSVRSRRPMRRIPLELCRIFRRPKESDLQVTMQSRWGTIIDGGVSWEPFAPLHGHPSGIMTARGVALIDAMFEGETRE